MRGVEEGVVRVRRGNGALLRVALADFPEKLLKHVAANLWPAALQVSVRRAFAVCVRYLAGSSGVAEKIHTAEAVIYGINTFG